MLHLLDAIYRTPWALHPVTLALVLQVAERWAGGDRLSPAAIGAAVGDAPNVYAARASAAAASGGGAVAVLPIYGLLAARQYAVQNSSTPLSSTELIGARISAAASDSQVGAIILDVDSPGGDAMGVAEAGERIAAAAKIKPVIAVVNNQAASGAYWLASQATEIVMAPDSLAGSIGVRTAHIDASEHYKREGLSVTHIHAGRHKVEGSDTGPMTDEYRVYMQGIVDGLYESFTKSVARGRGVSLSAARGPAFGEGRMMLAPDAVAAGMADRIDTLEATIQRYAKPRNQKAAGMGRDSRARALALAQMP